MSLIPTDITPLDWMVACSVIGVDLLLDGVGHHVGDDIGRENQVQDECFRRRKIRRGLFYLTSHVKG